MEPIMCIARPSAVVLLFLLEAAYADVDALALPVVIVPAPILEVDDEVVVDDEVEVDGEGDVENDKACLFKSMWKTIKLVCSSPRTVAIIIYAISVLGNFQTGMLCNVTFSVLMGFSSISVRRAVAGPSTTGRDLWRRIL